MDALAIRITEGLRKSGKAVHTLYGIDELLFCGLETADALVCAGPDDTQNLEMALRARQISPDIRVVTRLRNDVLREALAADNGPGAVLGVASLAAPAVVEACLDRTTHTIPAAGVDFVVSGTYVTRDGTLRDIFGDLAPVAVHYGDASPHAAEVIACPGRDLTVREGDWTAMIGTAEELRAQGISTTDHRPSTNRWTLPWAKLGRAVRALREDINPIFFRALGLATLLLAGATVLLRFTYQRPGMSFVDALYFATETIATVGYGDFSFVSQPTWLRLFSIFLMFAGIATTAIVMAFVVDLLLSHRISQNSGRRRVRTMSGHVIVVGLGSFGIRVATDLRAAGYEVAVIESAADNRYLDTAAELEIPVIFGDATLPATWDAARLDVARSVAVLTHDDITNIEVGLVLRNRLQERWSQTRVVMRIFDNHLSAAVSQRFALQNVHSTVELAAPWFIGAALGLQVLGTFSVGHQSFTVGAVDVQRDSELDAMPLIELSTRTRVFAIARGDDALWLHPRRDACLLADDTAYIVGPYRELLATLRMGKRHSS